MTKCGRYGSNLFDYSPARIRASVELSLSRLNTNYLDTVCLHDVEFVCTPVAPKTAGNHLLALTGDRAAYGGGVSVCADIAGRRVQADGQSVTRGKPCGDQEQG